MGHCYSKSSLAEITHPNNNKRTKPSALVSTNNLETSSSHQSEECGETAYSMDSSSAGSHSQHKSVNSPAQERKGNMINSKKISINQKYKVLPTVAGYGVTGFVHSCIDLQTNQLRAVKSIEKTKCNRPERIRREVAFLSQMDHPNIIKAYDVFEEKKFVHIVTELCNGGELFYKILEKSALRKGKRCFFEKEAAVVIQSLLSAVSYLHKNDIIHRDIKPENILFTARDNKDSNDATSSSTSFHSIKLIDFGLSIRHNSQTQPPLTSRVGTSYYMSPELLNGKYDRSCDLWSIGVITYMMLCGKPPFNGLNDKAIFDKIKRGTFVFDSPAWSGVSELAKDFVQCLLQKDPEKRLSADMALDHAWLRSRMMDPRQRMSQ